VAVKENGVNGVVRVRRHPSRNLLNFPAPPTGTTGSMTNGANGTKRAQEIYLILNPRDDKCERRVVLVPTQPMAPVRVGRVINPTKGPAKFDNLLFDTKVLSRNHAEVYCDPQGRVFIRDLGSSNGTYINGFRLSPDAIASEPFPLVAGQELVMPPHRILGSSLPLVSFCLSSCVGCWN
jgi:pSer/pThr/pTyr-binding forkhead associated (FHA) protein